MHTAYALCSTSVSSAAMVHWYDLAQLCWITLMIGSQGSSFSFIFSHGCSRSLGLSHHNVSRLPHCLLFLHRSYLLFFASPICFCSLPRSTTKHHIVCPRCRVHSFTHGSPSCCSHYAALTRHIGNFTLLRAPAAERNMISFAIGALFQRVAAE